VGHVAQLVERAVEVALEPVECLQSTGGVRPDELARLLEPDHQPYQLLLGAVVKVAFDAPPFGVRGRDDARARRTQLVGLASQRVQ
jgi:hypothetical protein